ncbi:hypothetical protein [Robbsia andropogonis]|uniref:hypothetical protein n=1 Tax=Robbsia andropogonis TaxID=28092 RepID=UPI0004632F8C|nr:hypothetical protein [Robbsia andropogonis]
MSDGNGVTPPKQPPSLVGGAASSSTAPKPAGAEPRILAGLDGKGAKAVKGGAKAAPVGPRGARKGTWIGVVALLALVVVAGGVWRSQQRVNRDEPLTDARVSSGTADGSAVRAQQGEEHPPPSGTARMQGTNNAAGGSPPPTQSATIVNDTSGQPATDSRVTPPALAAQQEDPVKALAEKNDTPDKRRETTAPSGAADAKAKRAEKKMTRHERLLAEREERARERANDRTQAAPAAKSEDPDADILAALFKHTNATDAKGSPVATSKGAVSAKSHGSAKPVAGSLAAKVEACRSKGFFNGEVCRWQVCNGHWGSDPACPGNPQPSAATSAH